MVICKYYRQGNCRYGQYCQFEHVNHFGNTKNEDDIIIVVAKEVLLAERGGQWLLSCFAPLKDRPCITDMKDLSPEEVRWEMYQAQKNGMVEQAKLHFQQLCQDMKAKREMLKNPTRETIAELKKLLGSGQKSGLNAANNTGGKSLFNAIYLQQSPLSFTTPQVNNTSTNNVFGSTVFGVQNNPFGGGRYASSNNAMSIFGKSNNNTTSVFGGAATFGNSLGGFSTPTSNAGSIFGTNGSSTSFSSVQNNALNFGTPQNNPVFGGTSQNVFAQNNVFGATPQLGNVPTGSLFNNSITSQANTPLFSAPTTTVSSSFGGSSSGLQTNSVFGVSTTSSSGSFNGGIFTQSKAQIPAFEASVFGGVTPPNYTNNSAGNSIFGGGQTFGTPAIFTNSNIFGGSTAAATSVFGVTAATTTPAFGTPVVATTTPAFGASVATTAPAFNLSQQSNNTTDKNTNSTMSVGTMPFGTPSIPISSPFISNNPQQFDSTSTNSAPFAGTGFGTAVASTNNTFGTTETSSNLIFANAGTTFATSNETVPNSTPFPAFSNINTSSSPFSSTASTTPTVTTANPFAPRMQPQGGPPFGNIMQNQSNVNTSPFEKSPFNTTAANTIIDDTVYSLDGTLTDDEKNMFLSEKFIFGKIPLKSPTKDIR
ncbi:hypothetical protein PUN28_002730 [Cardiocondyla obscurior]|uniref:Nucleoporin NUP42 n=1 Tax=Cardiocondyla obscurior TaxID=286306 RepID=A0AAW2GW39_9HYME